MLSIFTLTVLGAFGASNALTDVSDRADDDDDRDDEGFDDGAEATLGGQDDLIARLDSYAALNMRGPDTTPTSEAYLPAERYADAHDARSGVIEDAVVAQLTPEEIDLIAGRTIPATDLGDLDDDEPNEVISVAVGGPGAVTPDPTEAGFRTQLEPEDELTLNIAPDLPGQILAVHSVHDTAGGDDVSVGLRYSLNFYILPEGQGIPVGSVTGTEAEFIEAHGLQKLGEVDLGQFEARFDPESGDTVVTADSRQVEPPHVLANRPVTEMSALFG
ncbi:hypothetical protein P6F26_07525 [Roseibacterium sp. SDUM158017]|uniref:hypothetical protein n=1 Tax=Roseicyclus salinarum TaxID=3036773 RepID=UPI00241575E6|nr:hypothetical protein [Roseibacterium sp. SDUM158017]MDG4648291.1 hypothetical protein [Roseibacterium sp. SDUM158017]